MISMLQPKFLLAPLCQEAAETQRRISENLKLQIKLEVSAGLLWFEMPLKEISTSVCVDVIKLQSWNGLRALSVYLASIIFYL